MFTLVSLPWFSFALLLIAVFVFGGTVGKILAYWHLERGNKELPQLKRDEEIVSWLAKWMEIGLTNLADHDRFKVRYYEVPQERLRVLLHSSLSKEQYPEIFIQLVRAAKLHYDIDGETSDRVNRDAVEPAIKLGLLIKEE